jgi:GDP-4-dehydro-6-deoxy-D-mannose reductase
MTARRVLITGAAGFSGRWLIRSLRALERDTGESLTLIGTGRGEHAPAALDHYERLDVTDASALDALVHESRPDWVFHLAGASAFHPPAVLERVNVGGFTNLVAALDRVGRPVRLITIGSAAELGRAGVARLPADEDAVCAPESAYGQSKLAVTREVLARGAAGPVKMIVARTFNLVGPGLDRRLSLGTFASQLADIVRGSASAVRCGSLEARRDFVDVRDAVAAYVLLARLGQAGRVYHVCAGQSHRLADLLERMMQLADIHAPVVVDQARVRPNDLPDVYGSHARLTAETAWRPVIGIDRSLRDMLAETMADATVGRSFGKEAA